MGSFSKREYLLMFRKSFDGPLKFSKGDLFWSKISSVVNNMTEYFVLQLDECHPEYSRLSQSYKKVYLEDWDGTFRIPCNYLEFVDSDIERDQRGERELQLQKWKKSYHGS